MPRFSKINAYILSNSIDACSQLRRILARILEVMNKNALDTSSDELFLAIIPMDKINRAELAHINLADYRKVLVQKDELEVRCDDQVKPVFVRKANGGYGAMRLSDIK